MKKPVLSLFYEKGICDTITFFRICGKKFQLNSAHTPSSYTQLTNSAHTLNKHTQQTHSTHTLSKHTHLIILVHAKFPRVYNYC